MSEDPSPPKELFCSFCRKSQHKVSKMVSGPSALICNECVGVCLEIIHGERAVLLSKLREQALTLALGGQSVLDPLEAAQAVEAARVIEAFLLVELPGRDQEDTPA